MTDLNTPGEATALSKRIATDIAEYNIKAYDDGHRNHLGASIIGEECARKIWYTFRWCFTSKYPIKDSTTNQLDHDKTRLNHGRMMRLFNRGHREEYRFAEWLRGMGCKVWVYEIPPTYDVQGNELTKGKQFRISGIMGHFGGSLDGIAILPESYGIAEPVLLEFKTSATGGPFKDMLEKGMKLSKQQHYAQASCYASDPKYNFKYALYLFINKNDDDLHVELVKLDHNLGQQMRAKAERIILAGKAPARMAEDPTYWKCKYCEASHICHEQALPERNCRSCSKATPAENAEWYCIQHNNIIPQSFIPIGCTSYHSITLAQIRKK